MLKRRYQALQRKARQAASAANDPDLRQIAYHIILAHMIERES